jgi:hypothetical protein
MYRLPDKSPDSPKNSRRPARATANEAGNRPGQSAVGTVETTTVHSRFGRPVTGAGQQNATPFWSGVLAFGGNLGQRKAILLKMWRPAHLQAGVDGCSIRFAYQAADAGHPRGEEQARREQGNFADSFKPYQGAGGESSRRKSITRGKRRLHPM